MTANSGHQSALRVLLSGPAASELEGSLAGHPSISLIRSAGGAANPRAATADVALHVVASSSASGIAEDVRALRTVADIPLILAAYGEPNGIVETGLAIGAADVVVLPQPAEMLLFALRKAANGANGGAKGRVVTVFSPKGGSGKTMIATNLAAAAAQTGMATLLVDFDLQFGDAALALGMNPRATIADLATSPGTVDRDKLHAFVSADPRSALNLLAAPKRPEEGEVVGQTELAGVLATARTAYDAVVVDTGPLFDRALLAALDHTDQLLLVCNPEVTSLKNVRIGLETLDQLGFARERISLIANRMGARGGVERSDIEQALGVKIACELPDDPAVPVAVNRATPVVLADEASRFARAVTELSADAFAMAAEPQETPRERRLLLRGRR
jgi:pilus assembly protein CpaE